MGCCGAWFGEWVEMRMAEIDDLGGRSYGDGILGRSYGMGFS